MHEQMDPNAALDSIQQAYNQAAAALQNSSDLETAYQVATRLADNMRELADAAALIRAKSAQRIWESEQLSLSGLAAKIGVSKARADQLIKAARNSDQNDAA
ncbi:hypothetical protein ACFOY2_12015 [Nonomuraea purpurea]|uniref:RNA polymerase sigma-70 region 4 domain-containing protein n=1 Tax=Nonomuraea purpurea TaxID=1849276 RepID=A0ABV8G1S2_9ACTN